MDIKTSKTTAIHLHSPFRLSEDKNLHLILLALTFGKCGFGIYLFGFFIGFGWNE
jgi:hypothetical protein